jgi:[acyl-carrier-protein] S-malonyltransferase
MAKTVWVFPGQGSQQTGMGAELAADPRTVPLFDEAREILGWSVVDIASGPKEILDRTTYTQPALFTVSVALARLLSERTTPDYVAGHSLGEFAALCAAGVFDFAEGLALVRERAVLMDAQQAGTMSALIGFDRSQLEALVAERPGVVIANDNNPMQVVISGTPERVAEVSAQVKAKRVVPLAVSGAFHSPLMAQAARDFAVVLDRVQFRAPRVPVLQNVDPLQPVADPQQIKVNLQKQIDHPVRWRETMLTLADLGVTTLVEIGPGTVLTGLAKKTVPALQLVNVQTLAEASGG